ncbi:MAG: acyltransferase [Candidatus Krumholzibacteriia bacterium]
MMQTLFGKARWYQALSWAYDEMTKRQAAHPAREQLRHIGPDSVLHPRVWVTHPGRVHIGDWTTIYNDTFIHSQGGCHIGDYVGIGYGVTILTFNHNYRNAETIPFDNKFFLQPVIIRDHAWIGFHSRILPGIEIGEGAIVGMGSVVTKNVPPLAIVLGNPAEVVGRRSEEHFKACRDAGRVIPHRISAKYGEIIETIPVMTRRRYAAELRDLGLLDQE